MKSLRFFSSIAAFLLRKKSKPLFFSVSSALAPAVRPDDGCGDVIFGEWGLLKRMTLIAPREVGCSGFVSVLAWVVASRPYPIQSERPQTHVYISYDQQCL